MFFYADTAFVKNNTLTCIGWTAGEKKENSVEIRVTSRGKEVPFSLTHGGRPDVGYALFRDPKKDDLGVFIMIPSAGNRIFEIAAVEMEDGKEVDRKVIRLGKSIIGLRSFGKSVKKYLIEKRHWAGRIANKVLKRNYHKYAAWFQEFRSTPMELAGQRKYEFSVKPKFSILLPVYRTPVPYLNDAIGSVVKQTYDNWELCIVNGDPSEEEVRKCLSAWQENDPRIKVKEVPENLGIAGNTNEALSMATGEYIAMLDHDDTVEPDVLYWYARRIEEKPETDLLYCDEDKITERSDYYFYPNFKSDYNPDMIVNNNYICHMLSVRRSLAEEIGGWTSEYNGAQDFDFILKCVERTTHIEHIRRVLYHWRSYENSTSKNTGNKNYALQAGADAINAHYERMGIRGHAVPASVGGWYVSKYELESTPLVSVLIPNKDHTDDLEVCLNSIFNRATYQNLEVIVIENNSTDPKTFGYYDEMLKKYPRTKLVKWPGNFNFSAINNFGFRASSGEYIMLLNNDTEIITPDIFESMLYYAMRGDVGMVGARLLYQDGTVQHAGVLVGASGLADHPFKGNARSDPGYMCRAITSHDVSAVTAACIMVPRKVYEEVDGLDEKFEVAFNDVDFCLRIRKAGYLIVYDAQAELFHYESKSRGIENTPEKFVRFGKESELLSERWDILVHFEDPYYNPNMSYLFYFQPDFPALPFKRQEVSAIYISKGDPEHYDPESTYYLAAVKWWQSKKKKLRVGKRK